MLNRRYYRQVFNHMDAISPAVFCLLELRNHVSRQSCTIICGTLDFNFRVLVLIMILNWHDFDAVFQQKPDYAPDQKSVETIVRHRKEFGDELFFDRIWKSIGLTHRKEMENNSSHIRLIWYSLEEELPCEI